MEKFMIPFSYKDKNLFCEDANLTEIAEQFGTPTYVYSKKSLFDNFSKIDKAFGDYPHKICFALKSNSNNRILELLAEQGAGADVVSGGELALALKAGFPADRIVYASVGKTDKEIEFAIKNDILALNVESCQELQVVSQIAESMNKKASVSIRINPDVDIEGHPYITTGTSANKFGIQLGEAESCMKWASKQSHINLVGIHCHIGSLIDKLDAYIKSVEILVDFVLKLRKQDGITLNHIDIGGGLGIDYHKVLAEHGDPFTIDPKNLAQSVIPMVKETGCELLFEPGRSVIGPGGALLTRILYTKETKGKRFIIVDAGMSDLIRPSLYGAFHEILPVIPAENDTLTADIVGPICESGDFLGKNRQLPNVKRGDLLAVMTAGAYGYTLANNYNTRGKPAEVLVDGNAADNIRERELMI